MPKEERDAIEHADEIFRFINQSHISKKNVARLKSLVDSSNGQTVHLAEIVLQVAEVQPYKKRRMKVLAQKHPDLLCRLSESGLDLAEHW